MRVGGCPPHHHARARALQASPTARHFTLAVLSLAMGGFAIGTTEFVTMGLLPQIADGVSISIPTAGNVISAYAVGVVIGAPVLAFLGARLPRRGLLVALMVAYAVGNAASALATSYGLLSLARVATGFPHGAYFGVASLVAASLAPEGRKGRAVAMVMLGLSVANVVGVPAATWLGQHLGWRSAYWAVTGLSLLTALLVLAFVPSCPGDAGATGRRELRAFREPQVWLTLLAGAIGFGGMFAVFSYIAPTVTEVGGLPQGAVPAFLLAFGVGMVVGTWLAGELADWSVFRSLLGSALGMAVVLLLFSGAGARRLVAAARRLRRHGSRLGAGGEPAAAPDGRRGRGADHRGRTQPRLTQHRQRRRRLARRPRHRRRLRLPRDRRRGRRPGPGRLRRARRSRPARPAHGATPSERAGRIARSD